MAGSPASTPTAKALPPGRIQNLNTMLVASGVPIRACAAQHLLKVAMASLTRPRSLRHRSMTTGSSDTAADPESPKEPSDPFLARAQKMLGSNSEKVTEVAFWMLQKQTELQLVETQLRYYKENNNVLIKKAKKAHELELRKKIQNEKSYFKYILSYPTQTYMTAPGLIWGY